jgi:hypothetical protein
MCCVTAVAAVCVQVLKRINELYDAGLSAGAPGAVGLKGIADALGLGKQVRKPRKKIRCVFLFAGKACCAAACRVLAVDIQVQVAAQQQRVLQQTAL